MTDNRTTELLRKLLDERGLSCQTHYLHASWRVGQKLYGAVDNLDGTLTVDNLTPEQAIAATLGNHEIVRCRDCVYFDKYENDEISVCYRFDNEQPIVEPDGFCAWGERRES